MSRLVQEFTKGLWKEVPPFRFVLGLCPILAVTSSVSSAIGLGCGVIFVLLVSNFLISMFRNFIPAKIRVPVFIVIIASAVTIVELSMEAYFYSLYRVLGIWIPLIVVNCLILGRAEAFARKNPILYSIADALGMGLGFTLSLTTLASIREIIGAGTWFGIRVMPSSYLGFELLQQPPGAFICLGLILAFMNFISLKIEGKRA
ncbi:electron transport complex subunit E [Desulfothermus naphthae]